MSYEWKILVAKPKGKNYYTALWADGRIILISDKWA
jgi:hypothetical protein